MTFRPPVRDLLFALETLGHGRLCERAFPDLDPALVEAILDGAGVFARDVSAPLNRTGDLSGARLVNGSVSAPPGFAEAYRQFIAQGWNALSAEPQHGGQGLTKAVTLAVFEMLHASNMAFALCPMLTQGAIEALIIHGSERQQRLILPKLVSGEWAGTMDLTEPQSGSDLSGIAARARPDGDGYRITGQKIFITWGDHDMAENICHLVLARMPDAPAGTRGISLFLATRDRVDDDGRIGARNAIRVASIEHKLGIHGSPTCVMLYEDAYAELIGEPGQGLAQMFVMMNAARLQVGVQGVGIAERAFQQALAFSLERRQGRSSWHSDHPSPIYHHPDVRLTLTLMKARINAARGLCLATALAADAAAAAQSEVERAFAQARADLLTPIAKAWSTDLGVDAASAALQVHGGMGFIEETGAAQHYRDARIAPIYEGTNGIQAIDLVVRKLTLDQGAAMRALCGEMRANAVAMARLVGLERAADRLMIAIDALERASDWLLAHEGAAALAAATDYLKLCGDVIGGSILAGEAIVANQRQDPYARTKAPLMRLYASRILATSPALAEGLTEGADDLEAIEAAALAD